LAKIAVELERALSRRAITAPPGITRARALASGDGWSVDDVLCTCGPSDRTYEEQHSWVCIAVVASGTFQYRSASGSELMTPGSLLLGNAGQVFECGHEHGAGDRCISFRYSPEYFERLAAGAGVRRANFAALKLPPLRPLSVTVAYVLSGLERPAAWEELSARIAGDALRLASDSTPAAPSAPAAVARVTRVVRRIEHHPEERLGLADLAREAGLSPYHFLRVFQALTGLTPHHYILRIRLRNAAMRLASPRRSRVLDVALDSGFGDVSNFTRSFRAEFGMTPRTFQNRRSQPLLKE
jgi:AraC family transcriptional regulator